MEVKKQGCQPLTLMAFLGCALASILWLPASYAASINYDALLQQLQNQQQQLMLPLSVDGKNYGEVNASLRGDELESITASAFIHALPFNTRTQKQLLSLLETTPSQALQTVLTPEQLAPFGIVVIYDAVALQLVVSIPLARLAVQVISNQGATISREPQYSSNTTSFFVNGRYGYQYFTNALNSPNTSSFNDLAQDVSSISARSVSKQHTLNLDSALTLKSWTVEGAGQWQQSDYSNIARSTAPAWRRNYTRLIHDYIDLGARFTFGDLSYSTADFQRFNALAGLGFSSNRQLSAYSVGRETGGESFFIDDTSKVEVYVNNRLVRSLYLTRGNYEVRDLPGVSGVNDVHLRVSNAQGELTEFNYSFVFNQQLLAAREHDFSYNLGVARNYGQAGASYNDEPMVSLHHKYGLLSNLTLGGNLQGVKNHYLLGVGVQWATIAGSFSGALAASIRQGLPTARATLLQYRFEKRLLGQLNLSWQFFEPSFAAPNAQVVSAPVVDTTGVIINNRKSQAIVHFGRAIGSRFVFNASYRTNTTRHTQETSDTWEAGFAARLFNRLRVNASARRSSTEGLWQHTNYRIILSWQSFSPEQFVDAQYESNNQTYRTHYFGRFYQQQHTLGAQLLYEQSQPRSAANLLPGSNVNEGAGEPQNTRQSAALRYDNHRVEGSASVEQANNTAGEQQVTRFGVGAALVMADNQWAFSGPVSGSFVIVDSDVPLNGTTIGINPKAGGGYQSLITQLSPAVISGVSPYYVNHVRVNAEGTDLEYQAQAQNVESISGYHAGVLVDLKGDKKKIIDGQLVHIDGRPLTYVAGEAVNQDTGVGYLFFTDDAGHFLLEALNPGLYKLTLFGRDDAYDFSVPNEGDKRITLAAMVVP
ncbi:fimbrial biogenesis outer membrane usher protein [Marinagarivorans algicola]|uniref:fimbrial biogenesis outer membrane usher protein n=1 Tax=Marinagarivorans algicola TaxID=1513270 RepID=UPI0006B8D118|nr:fimbrial biogenesis outer membrane usher protein [Marinagarivorans algicola]